MLPVIASSLIFIAALVFIFSEKVNRTIVAISGAVLMVVIGQMFGFYDQDKAIKAIDYNTIGLLLGMMTLVALLEPTGFFRYLAIWVGRFSRGKPFTLLIMLGTVTTLVSMFLDNVTTVVLIAPVTILICEILGVNPRPMLMAEALLSDTGGAATLVGDPPNILIASAADFSFNSFLTHALPVVAVSWIAALFLLKFMFADELVQSETSETEALMKLNPQEALKDGKTARKVLIVIALAIVLFLLEELLQILPALVALGSAALGLLWVRPDINEIFKKIEWSVLVFFAALFVMVGGMQSAGVLESIGGFIAQIAHIPSIWLGLILLWAVALLSAFVDNVPVTIALIPIIQQLGQSGINIAPLWWALVFGAGFGGNGTIIGSSANIFVATISERTRYPITSSLWLKRGLPVMITTCLVASIIFLLIGFTIGW